MTLSRSRSTSHTNAFVRENSKPPRELSNKERFRGAVKNIEFQKSLYKKKQKMSRSHYTGQLATDDGDYGVHFHRMESGAFAMMDDAQLPMIGSKSTTHLPKPEDDDEFSYDDMSTAHKMNILKQRHEVRGSEERRKAGASDSSISPTTDHQQPAARRFAHRS